MFNVHYFVKVSDDEDERKFNRERKIWNAVAKEWKMWELKRSENREEIIYHVKKSKRERVKLLETCCLDRISTRVRKIREKSFDNILSSLKISLSNIFRCNFVVRSFRFSEKIFRTIERVLTNPRISSIVLRDWEGE